MTGPIRTGKTTALMHWLKDRNNVGGILTPDHLDQRQLFLIREKRCYPLELKEGEQISDEEKLCIGRFAFYKSAFYKAAKTIKEDLLADINWVIIDELGKLEMKDQGLSKIIIQAIHSVQRNPKKKLLIVIRDFLLASAIEKYGLEKAKCIPKNDLHILDE